MPLTCRYRSGLNINGEAKAKVIGPIDRYLLSFQPQPTSRFYSLSKQEVTEFLAIGFCLVLQAVPFFTIGSVRQPAAKEWCKSTMVGKQDLSRGVQRGRRLWRTRFKQFASVDNDLCCIICSLFFQNPVWTWFHRWTTLSSSCTLWLLSHELACSVHILNWMASRSSLCSIWTSPSVSFAKQLLPV